MSMLIGGSKSSVRSSFSGSRTDSRITELYSKIG